MHTATLTIATDDTVTLPVVRVAGRHRRPSLREPVPTVVILLAVVLMVAVAVAAVVWPAPAAVSSLPPSVAYATVADTAPLVNSPCTTDADCAGWDREHGHSQAGGPLVTVPQAWVADEGGGPVVEVDPGYLGDDNGDGVIDEGESGWVCWSMGNHRCSLEPLQQRSA